jgi:hypothetical protein
MTGTDMTDGMEEKTVPAGAAQAEPPTSGTPRKDRGWHPDEKAHRRHERIYWGALILLTAVAAAGAAASAVFTYRAANASIEQVSVAKDTENRQLRSYLHISHGPITVIDNTASAEIRISHSGQTPAYKIKLDADILVGHFPLPATEKLSLPTGGIPTYEFGALYGPDPIKQTISMPLNSNDAIEIQKRSRDRLAGGLQVFYLFGRVRYLDIFGQEWPYDFCFSFDPINSPQGSERGCEKYNKPG